MKKVRGPARTLLLGIAACVVFAGLGTAGAPGGADPADDGIHDPWQGFNRKIFWFNEKFDQYLFEPFAKGWDFVLPDMAQQGISNVFENLSFPINFANNLLQAKPVAALEHVGLFLLNSTLGMGGLIDAGARVGLHPTDEDFGQTLGYWGVPAGPYLVLPFLGPSNPRDAVGRGVDGATRIYPFFAPFWVNTTANIVDLSNTRAELLDEISESRERAFDYYAFVRNAFVSYRENQITDSADPAPEEAEEKGDDLYYFEEE